MTGLLERLHAGEVVCGDGGWGTMLMARGLEPGASPEALNLTAPGLLAEIAASYVEAGAELITTNTFGGSALRLAGHGLADRTGEINAAAVAAVRPAVAGRALISASIGPTGKLLEPYGDAAPELLADAFAEQIGAVVSAGADVVCIETMIDLAEARLAIRAARAVSPEVPVIATMTFDRTPRGYFTAMGVSVDAACDGLAEAGADAIGSNCGNGIDRMVEIAAEFVRHSELPVVIQSNAGLPEHGPDGLLYPESPGFMAARVPRLIDLGVRVIGGCCGTGPDHVRALRAAIDAHCGARPAGQSR